jgi:TM2 domain-containing membrane protein YozV
MKTILKLVACWAALGVAMIGAGTLVHLLRLRMILPPNMDTGFMHFLTVLGAGGLLVLGLYPLARGLAGSSAARAGALGSFLFLAFGVNTILDGAIFTSYFQGAIPAHTLIYALQSLFLACALGFCFGQTEQPAGFPARGWLAWTGRGLTAWLVWPVIYFFFGVCVSPIVVPYYQNGSIRGLHIPPMSTIIAMQLLRSVIFMASSLPLIALWKGSRRGLWLALGLAHAVAVGIYGLAAGTFLPAVLRITHGVEITCDSFAYAGLLVLLFTAPAAAAAIPAATRQEPQLRAL